MEIKGRKFEVGETIAAFDRISIANFEEIKSYIKENLEPGTFNYVILDDNNDMLDEQDDFFIETDWELGINESDVEKAIKILNRE